MAARFEGTTVKIGGNDYVMPPLSLGSLKRHDKDIKSIADEEFIKNTDTMKVIDIQCGIIYSSFKRNYPDVDYDDFLELLDQNNITAVISAVFQVSGFSGGDEEKPGKSRKK